MVATNGQTKNDERLFFSDRNFNGITIFLG